MLRSIKISREEAELLTDLLMLSDHHCARELSKVIRKKFGMVDEETELKIKNKTIK